MEIITTQKGGEALIWQGCKFTLNRKMANGKKYWRCAKRICPARITTEGNEVLQQTNGHNHPVEGVEAEVERVKHELRERAREEVSPIPAIYNDALVDTATQVELPTFPSQSSMYRSQRSTLPTLPMSQEDVRIEGRWEKTLSGEQFFLRKEGEVLIFATHTNMHLLAEATTIYVDGTFEITCLL